MPEYKTAADITWLVNQIRQPFKDLDDADKLVREVEAGTIDYKPALKKLLPRIADPAPMVHRGASEIFALIESILSWPTAATVTQDTEGIRAAEQNDNAEAWLAVIADNLDPTGGLFRKVYGDMVRYRFAAIRLGVNEYNPPEEPEPGETDKEYNERCERYHNEYRRNYGSAVPPDAIGFLEEDDVIQVAVIDEMVPIIDLAAARDDDPVGESGDPLDAYSILSHRFGPDIRAGDGTAYDASHAHEWLGKEVRCLTLLTAEKECVWVHIGAGRDDRGRFASAWREDEGLSRENTYGEVPLVLFKATYRAHAPMKERYEGAGAPIAYEYNGWNLSESIRLSLVTNPQVYEQMPPEVAMQINDFLTGGGDPDTLKLPERKAGHAQLARGQVSDPTRDIYNHLREVSQDYKDSIAEMKATILSFSPNPENVNTNTPAAVVLAMIEAGVRRFESLHAQITAGREKIYRMVIHDAAWGGSAYYAPEEEGDDKLRFRVTKGASKYASKPLQIGERTVSRAFLRKFPNEARVDVSIIASSDAQRAARTSHVLALRAEGLASDADVLAANGEQDISKKLEELAAQEQVKLLAPQMMRVDLIDQLLFNANLLGVEDPDAYVQARLPEIAPDQQYQSNQNGQKALTGGQTNPPPTAVPAA